MSGHNGGDQQCCVTQYCQTSDLGLRLEADFVFPLSQQQQQQQEQ